MPKTSFQIALDDLHEAYLDLIQKGSAAFHRCTDLTEFYEVAGEVQGFYNTEDNLKFFWQEGATAFKRAYQWILSLFAKLNKLFWEIQTRIHYHGWSVFSESLKSLYEYLRVRFRFLDQYVFTPGRSVLRYTQAVTEPLLAGHYYLFSRLGEIWDHICMVIERIRRIYAPSLKIGQAYLENIILEDWKRFYRFIGYNPNWIWHNFIPNERSDTGVSVLIQSLGYWACIHHSGRLLDVLRDEVFFEYEGELFCPAFGNIQRCEDIIFSAECGRTTIYLFSIFHYISSVRGYRKSPYGHFLNAVIQFVFVGLEIYRYYEILVNWAWEWTGDTNCFSPYEDNVCTELLYHALLVWLLLMALCVWNFFQLKKKRRTLHIIEAEKIEEGSKILRRVFGTDPYSFLGSY